MQIELRSGGIPLSSIRLRGPLLTVPDGLRAHRTDGRVILEASARGTDGAPDVIVGDLPLLYVDPESQLPAVSILHIPPPPPFGGDDIADMWSLVAGSDVPIPDSVPAQARQLGSGEVLAAGLDGHAVPLAIGSLLRMLRRWPQYETTEIVWRPPDVRGGREDVRVTDRLGARRAGRRRVGAPPIPDLTARRRGASVPWGSRQLATACVALGSVLRDREQNHQAARTFALIDHSARMASQYSQGGEATLSSWPQDAQASYRAILRALIQLALTGPGAQAIPLCHLWRLYEAWVAVKTYEVMSTAMGVGELIEATAWTRRWTTSTGVEIRLHLQATVGRAPDDTIAGASPGFISVSSDLRPDALVALSHPSGSQAMICVDAKQRTSSTAMEGAAVASAASKYLWGLRHADNPHRFATMRTLIASSAPVPKMHDAAQSRIDASFMVPSGGDGRFAESLLAALEGALELLEAS